MGFDYFVFDGLDHREKARETRQSRTRVLGTKSKKDGLGGWMKVSVSRRLGETAAGGGALAAVQEGAAGWRCPCSRAPPRGSGRESIVRSLAWRREQQRHRHRDRPSSACFFRFTTRVDFYLAGVIGYRSFILASFSANAPSPHPPALRKSFLQASRERRLGSGNGILSA